MTLTRDDLCTTLRQKGFRITPQRIKILDIFFALPEGEHLSAEELLQHLNKDDSDISLATSYRTLKLLASLGVLREVDFAGDYKHYELIRADNGIQHQHIICIDCGTAKEFVSPEVFNASVDIARLMDFELIDTQLKLYGRCQDCQTHE